VPEMRRFLAGKWRPSHGVQKSYEHSFASDTLDLIRAGRARSRSYTSYNV
jgi:hypothetical protein